MQFTLTVKTYIYIFCIGVAIVAYKSNFTQTVCNGVARASPTWKTEDQYEAEIEENLRENEWN